MKGKRITRFILIFVLSGISFFLLTMPFHRIFSVFTVSEVRPSAVLYPLLCISFGWPSAFGIMTANFISDAVNGYSAAVLAEGIIPQLLYTMIPYYLWKRLMRGDEHQHRLDSAGRMLKFVLICFSFAVISGLGVGLIVYVNFHADFWSAALFVLLNNFDVSVILGCPLMVIANQVISRRSGTKRVLSRNEIIILITAAAEAAATAILVITVYSGGKTIGTYDIWNTIYLLSLPVNNLIILLSLIVMAIFGKAERHPADQNARQNDETD